MQSEDQFRVCNSTGGVTEVRGNCYGMETSSELILNIEQPSAKLTSDFAYVEGETAFLTSELRLIQYIFLSIVRNTIP